VTARIILEHVGLCPPRFLFFLTTSKCELMISEVGRREFPIACECENAGIVTLSYDAALRNVPLPTS